MENTLKPQLNTKHVNGQSRIERKVDKNEQRPALPVADITADHTLSLQNHQAALSGQSLGFHYNYNATDCAKVSCCITLSERIKRMESEFQLKFAALVFQSHSEIMLNMIQLRFSHGIKLRILSVHRLGGAAI